MLVISVPLSETIVLGFSRLVMRLSSSRTRRAPERGVSATKGQAFAGKIRRRPPKPVSGGRQ